MKNFICNSIVDHPLRLILPFVISVLLTNGLQADDIENVYGSYGGDSETVIAPELKIVSLNIAHGRKDGLNQIFLTADSVRVNLREIGATFQHLSPDVVSLQEADGPSIWSGRFDHVQYLAEHAGLPFFASARHSTTSLFRFGTALLSTVPMKHVRSIPFVPSPPTLRKGFLIATIPWNPGRRLTEPVQLNIASIHLDFSRRKVRVRQARELIEFLETVRRPLILTGDLNAGWTGKDPTVRDIARALDLHIFEPHSNSLGTYRSTRKRLDWILISSDLSFVEYTVIPEILSDHLAVSARISLK